MSIVLAAVDDSIAAEPVITAALALAPLFGSDVEAVHVGASAGITARSCAERLGTPFRTVPGEPLDQLVRLATEQVTAVVVGSRDRPTRKARVGHLALQLADRLAQPLLVVPPDSVPSDRIERVLVALKGRTGRAGPLQHTLEVVADGDLDVTIVHVDDEEAVPGFTNSAAHEPQEVAKEYLARYWPLGPRARLALPLGSPAEEVLAVAADIRPDVVVVGWPQGAGPEHGHVVRELLRRSPYPLLLVAVTWLGGRDHRRPAVPPSAGKARVSRPGGT